MTRKPPTLARPRDISWPTYRRLLGYSVPYWSAFALAVSGMLIDTVATAGFTALLEPLLDEGFLAHDRAVISWLPLVVVVIFVVRGIGGFTAEYGMARVGRSVIHDLRQQVFERYLSLPASFYDRHSSGQLVSRMTYNIEQVAEAVTNAVTVIFKDSFYVIGLLTVMLLQSVRLTLATLLIGPVIAVFVLFVSRRFRRLSRKIQQSVGDVSHRTMEVVSGHREIKIYGGHEAERNAFGDINANNLRQNLKLIATKAGSTSIIQLAAGIALAVIIWLATRETVLVQMTPGSFITFMTAMLGILPSLKRLTNVHVLIQKGVAAAETIFDVVDMPGEQDDGTRPIEQVRGELGIRNLSLVYPGNREPVLRNVSFEAHAGTVTAIVGRSGSGKSSLVSLVARFYAPTGGAIELDGANIQDYRLQDYRDQIAFVGQQVVLFEDTIARNIAYGRLGGASEADIIAAAERAHAMEFISRLPQGLQTRIGQDGVQLSGGQRQRIAIARAILKDAPVLILDEATSALDTESERHIQSALEAVMRSKTTLVIAHRLSTIENADQVVVMDQGQVVERGSHAELLRADGVYAALHRMQFADVDRGAGPSGADA